jgi:hypothetical protein
MSNVILFHVNSNHMQPKVPASPNPTSRKQASTKIPYSIKAKSTPLRKDAIPLQVIGHRWGCDKIHADREQNVSRVLFLLCFCHDDNCNFSNDPTLYKSKAAITKSKQTILIPTTICYLLLRLHSYIWIFYSRINYESWSWTEELIWQFEYNLHVTDCLQSRISFEFGDYTTTTALKQQQHWGCKKKLEFSWVLYEFVSL